MVKRIEYDDGTIMYKNENGQKHREDGPALIYPDGTKVWYKNGKLHRDDGPAVIYPNGKVSWWLNDVCYTFDEWCENFNISNEEKVELVLKYG